MYPIFYVPPPYILRLIYIHILFFFLSSNFSLRNKLKGKKWKATWYSCQQNIYWNISFLLTGLGMHICFGALFYVLSPETLTAIWGHSRCLIMLSLEPKLVKTRYPIFVKNKEWKSKCHLFRNHFPR